MGSELPKEWRRVRLGDAFVLEYGKGLPESKRKDGNILVFGSGGVVGYHNKPLVNGKGVIIGRKGQVGAVYYPKKPFWPIDTVFFIRENENYVIRFVYYLLKYVDLSRLTGDSAVPGLNRNIAYQEEILLPPLPEQRRIAEILGALDDKIELNHEMNKTLEAIAHAIFKHWFVDFEPFKDNLVYNEELGKEIPEGWEVVELKDVIHLDPPFRLEKGRKYPFGLSWN